MDGHDWIRFAIILGDDSSQILHSELIRELHKEVIVVLGDLRGNVFVHHLIELDAPKLQHVVEVAIHEPQNEVADDLLFTLPHFGIKPVTEQGKSEAS